MERRRKYTQEFKREAVGLTRSPGVTVGQIAAELGINASMLTRWRKELDREGSTAFQGQGKARDVEVATLKRELARVKKERDFLKEAATFFAKVSK